MSVMAMATTFEAVGDENAGAEIQARRLRLGMSVKGLAEKAGIDRGRLAALEAGDANVRATTIGAVRSALLRLEHEMGMDQPAESVPGAGTVRYSVKGVYGAEALVVEGPVANIADLEASVDRIMRRIQGRRDAEAESS